MNHKVSCAIYDPCPTSCDCGAEEVNIAKKFIKNTNKIIIDRDLIKALCLHAGHLARTTKKEDKCATTTQDIIRQIDKEMGLDN